MKRRREQVLRDVVRLAEQRLWGLLQRSGGRWKSQKMEGEGDGVFEHSCLCPEQQEVAEAGSGSYQSRSQSRGGNHLEGLPVGSRITKKEPRTMMGNHPVKC